MVKKTVRHIVIEKFRDTDQKIYEPGEVYPSPVNKKVTVTRLKELKTNGNKYNRPFIKEEEHAED